MRDTRNGWTLAISILAAFLGSIPGGRTADAVPVVAIERDTDKVRISFVGRLLWASSLAGPWVEITNAVSPWIFSSAEGSGKFFRAATPVGSGVFDGSTELRLRLSGPLQQHFELAYAGSPDGIFPPHREKPYFDGLLQLGDWELPIRARVRGNSSLQECPFPKLKFKVSKEDRVGTPFEQAREIKVGTHCAEGGRGTVGRLREEKAAAREATAYEAMAMLGFQSPKVRRAQVDYQDTSPGEPESAVGWMLSRMAMILEDVEVMADRLGARALSEDEISGLGEGVFSPQLVAELYVFHALLGNWDYSLGESGRGIWNTEVLEFPDGHRLPVAGDFDLASWVTGVVRGSAPRDYHPELGDVERETRFQLERIHTSVGAGLFAMVKERFLGLRSALEGFVVGADVDEEGRANAARHVSAFYEALATLP